LSATTKKIVYLFAMYYHPHHQSMIFVCGRSIFLYFVTFPYLLYNKYRHFPNLLYFISDPSVQFLIFLFCYIEFFRKFGSKKIRRDTFDKQKVTSSIDLAIDLEYKSQQKSKCPNILVGTTKP